MKIQSMLGAALLASTLAGCMTPSRFEWGNYEAGLYAYAKSPAQRATYRKTLEDAIKKGRATNRVAPGMLAELVYLHLEDGDIAGAVQLFREEMTQFPESRALMTSVIARATAPAATTNSESN